MAVGALEVWGRIWGPYYGGRLILRFLPPTVVLLPTHGSPINSLICILECPTFFLIIIGRGTLSLYLLRSKLYLTSMLVICCQKKNYLATFPANVFQHTKLIFRSPGQPQNGGNLSSSSPPLTSSPSSFSSSPSSWTRMSNTALRQCSLSYDSWHLLLSLHGNGHHRHHRHCRLSQ